MKKVPGKDLPDQDHVVRYVSWTKLLRDENDNVLGVHGEAFALRPADNSALSVNWLEFYDGDWGTRIHASVNAFRANRKLDGKALLQSATWPRSRAFVVLAVGRCELFSLRHATILHIL